MMKEQMGQHKHEVSSATRGFKVTFKCSDVGTGRMHRAKTRRIGACTPLRHALFDAKNHLSL
jgi:hypothetical protein